MVATSLLDPATQEPTLLAKAKTDEVSKGEGVTIKNNFGQTPLKNIAIRRKFDLSASNTKKIVTHEKQRMPFHTPLVTRFQPARQHADSKKPYVSNGAWQRLIAEVLIRNPQKTSYGDHASTKH